MMYGARRSTSAFRAGFLGDEVEVEGASAARASVGAVAGVTPVVDAPADVVAACACGHDDAPVDTLLVAAALHLLLVEQTGGVYARVDPSDHDLRGRFAAVRQPSHVIVSLHAAVAVLVRGGLLAHLSDGRYELQPVPVHPGLGELERVLEACDERRRDRAAGELHDCVHEQASMTLGSGVGMRRWRETARAGRLRLQILPIGRPAERRPRRVGPLALPPIPAPGLEHTIGDPFPERGWLAGTALDPVDGHWTRQPLLISPLEIGALLNGRSTDLRGVPRVLRGFALWRLLADRAGHHIGQIPLSVRSVDADLRQRLQIADSSDYRAQTRTLLRALEACGLISLERDGRHGHAVLHRPVLPGPRPLERWRKLLRRWIDALPSERHLLFELALSDADEVRAEVRRAWVELLQERRALVTITSEPYPETSSTGTAGDDSYQGIQRSTVNTIA